MAITYPMPSYSFIAEKAMWSCRYLAILTVIAAPISTAIASVASMAMLLFWLMSGEVGPTLRRSVQQPVGKVLVLFIVWLMISCLYAEGSWAEKFNALSSWKKLLYTLVLLGLFYQPQWKARLIHGYVAVMSIMGVLATFMWVLEIPYRKQPFGVVMTNHTAQSLAFVVAILCCILLIKQTLSLQKRGLLGALIVLLAFNILFVSSSRSGYLALPVATVFLSAKLFGHRKIPQLLAITAVVMVVAALTSTTLQQRIKVGVEEYKNAQNSQTVTPIGIRDIFRENTLELIKESPVLGYGTSSFRNVYSRHVAAKYTDWRGEVAADPHNQYLAIWVENGIIGLLLFLTYIYTALRQGLHEQPYGVLAASVLVMISVTSLFNSHFKTFQEGYLLAFFVGCLMSRQSVGQAGA